MVQYRIDKWLWSVRLFKTRNQATEACRNGKVEVNDKEVKPSKTLNKDDIVVVRQKDITRTVKVIGLLNNRVSAKLVPDYLEDQTPEEEYNKNKLKRELNHEYRDRGIGRPTKKDRRLIEQLKKNL